MTVGVLLAGRERLVPIDEVYRDAAARVIGVDRVDALELAEALGVVCREEVKRDAAARDIGAELLVGVRLLLEARLVRREMLLPVEEDTGDVRVLAAVLDPELLDRLVELGRLALRELLEVREVEDDPLIDDV